MPFFNQHQEDTPRLTHLFCRVKSCRNRIYTDPHYTSVESLEYMLEQVSKIGGKVGRYLA